MNNNYLVCLRLLSLLSFVLAVGCKPQENRFDFVRAAMQNKPETVEPLTTGGVLGTWGKGGFAVWGKPPAAESCEAMAWDGNRMSQISQLQFNERVFGATWLSHSRQWAITFLRSDKIGLYSTNGVVEKSLKLPNNVFPVDVGVSQNGRRAGIATGEKQIVGGGWQDTPLGVLDVDRGLIEWYTLPLWPGRPEATAYALPSEDGRYLAVTGVGYFLAIVDWQEKKVLWRVTERQGDLRLDEITFNDVAFSPDGSVLYTGGNLGNFFSLDVKTGRVLNSWPIGPRVARVAVSPDGNRVALAAGGALFLIDPSTKKLGCIAADGIGTVCLQFSPDGTRLASMSEADVRVWKLPELSEGVGRNTSQNDEKIPTRAK